MNQTFFSKIECGQTLPQNNIHAVSVSMPTLQDVIDYEEQTKQIKKIIKSGYPRFTMHPYLKIMASFIKQKYKVPEHYEVVILSSKKAVKIVSQKYFIHNPFEIDEPFGVILVLNNTTQLQKVLTFIQHVGCNLSSRFAQDYLLKNGFDIKEHKEELEDENSAYDIVISTLAKAYTQPKENVCLAPSGMNAIYGVLKGLKPIQEANGRTILVQFGWLYLDTMNIVKHHFNDSRVFFDVTNLDILEEYLQKDGFKVSAIITEVPTNPLVLTVDLPRLKSLCNKYNIPLVIDSTLATPYNLDLTNFADIFVESLTKFACGNADVLMGAMILNKNSKLSHINQEFFKHCDMPYIKEIQRMAYEIKDYEYRIKKINQNTKELIEFLQTQSYIKKIHAPTINSTSKHYLELSKHDMAYGGIISLEFNLPFEKVYNTLDFAKGPSLGTEFTLLMPYVYLAHYDMIISASGKEFLKEHNLPIDLLRVSVGCEDIEEIKKEFSKLNSL